MPYARVESLEEIDAALDAAMLSGWVLIQFGSPTCKLCPAFTEEASNVCERKCVDAWLYVDAHSCEDVSAAFSLRRLPAFALLHRDHRDSSKKLNPEKVSVWQAATGAQLEMACEANGVPFRTDTRALVFTDDF